MKLFDNNVSNCIFYSHCYLGFVNGKWRECPVDRWFTSTPPSHRYRVRKWNESKKKYFYFCCSKKEYGTIIHPEQKKYDVNTFYLYSHFYYKCSKKIDGFCPFFDKLINIYEEIKKTINKRLIFDSELIPYYNLHELLKNYPVGLYDDTIRYIADFYLGNNLSDGIYINKIIKNIKLKIKKATAVMCLIKTDCAFKCLVEKPSKK